MPNHADMLAPPDIIAASKPGTEEIVLTIVGGTMLSLALTRPRLRWMERLTEASPDARLWAERGLTVFAFAVGGYAWVTLFITLHGQLEAGPARLIRVAAYVLIAYAGLTHFEPFVNGRTRSLVAAILAYAGWAFLAAGVGAAFALDIRAHSTSTGWPILGLVSVTAAGCFLFWWLVPKFEAAVDRLFPKFEAAIERRFKVDAGTPELQEPAASLDSQGTQSQTSASVRIVVLSITLPILTRIARDAWRNRSTGASY